jgi:thiamine biosynthesis lipoprotein
VLERASWRALGTSVDLLVDGGRLEPARAAVAGLLDEVDRTYSRFRRDSELSRINARSGRGGPVSTLFGEAVAAALRVAAQTDGLVDPTIGRAMRIAGYDDDFSRIAGRDGPPIVRFEAVAGWRVIQLDRMARRIQVPVGVELDLGSTGKALAADLAAAAAQRASGAGGALVSLGGDIAIAGEVSAGSWRILVSEDSAASPSGHGEVIALRSGAVATSSSTVRHWRRGGQPIHHLLDPRTGRPAAGPWRTATVIGATCVDANAAATASIIRGADAEPWLAGLGLAARLVSLDGEVHYVGSWPIPAASSAA